MTPVHVVIAPTSIRVDVDGTEHVLPFGTDRLVDDLATDPPRPEQLTNAIGAVIDHVDDLVRLRPDVLDRPATLAGPLPHAIASVELGALAPLPFVLRREAAEDVFRTLATEPRRDRARNPGLDAALVDEVVAGCCAVVAIARRLRLDELTVVAAEAS